MREIVQYARNGGLAGTTDPHYAFSREREKISRYGRLLHHFPSGFARWKTVHSRHALECGADLGAFRVGSRPGTDSSRVSPAFGGSSERRAATRGPIGGARGDDSDSGRGLTPLDLPVLLDENLPAGLTSLLRGQGLEVRTVEGVGLVGSDDSSLLRYACDQRWVFVTQDQDFGQLAFQKQVAYFGVISLRPGILDAEKLLRSILALKDQEVAPPFFLTVRHDREGNIRVRSVPPRSRGRVGQ